LVLLSVPTPSNYLLNVSTKSQLPVHWVTLPSKLLNVLCGEIQDVPRIKSER